MPNNSRPDKRNLVRWTDDLDKSLLLAIQYGCQEQGVRIPFERVAELMGPKFSQGAIVQHLAKLRVKMIEANVDAPIPPPLKKGMSTKEPSKVYATPSRKRKLGNANTAAAIAAPAAAASARGKKTKKKKVKTEGTDDDTDNWDDEYVGSDEDYGAPKKKAKKTKQFKFESQNEASVSPKMVPDNTDATGIKIEEENDSPTMTLRGVRPNYKEIEAGLDEEDEVADNDSGEEDEDDRPLAQRTPAQPTSTMNGLLSPGENENIDESVTSPALTRMALMMPPDTHSYGAFGNIVNPATPGYVDLPMHPYDVSRFPLLNPYGSTHNHRRHSEMPAPSYSMSSNNLDYSSGNYNAIPSFPQPSAKLRNMSTPHGYGYNAYNGNQGSDYIATMPSFSTKPPDQATKNNSMSLQTDLTLIKTNPAATQYSRNNSWATNSSNSSINVSPTTGGIMSQISSRDDMFTLFSNDQPHNSNIGGDEFYPSAGLGLETAQDLFAASDFVKSDQDEF